MFGAALPLRSLFLYGPRFIPAMGPRFLVGRRCKPTAPLSVALVAAAEADNIGLSTSISGATAIAAGATAADSLVIHQGIREGDDKE